MNKNKIISFLITSMLGLNSWAFSNASNRVVPDVHSIGDYDVQATVYNQTNSVLRCKVVAGGRTSAGQVIQTFQDRLVPSGGFLSTEAYSYYAPFTSRYGHAWCIVPPPVVPFHY